MHRSRSSPFLLALAAALFAGGLQGSEEERPAPPCAAKDPDALWRSLLDHSPGDDAGKQEVRLVREGARARLVVLEDQLPDDSVAAMRSRYELAWTEGEGWRITACEERPVRCWRGEPSEGLCP